MVALDMAAVNAFAACVPDAPALVEAVLARASCSSGLHGPSHWKCVAYVGYDLLRATPGCDPRVPLLFALFHDAMRENDGHDPDHGRRAAALARELHATVFHLEVSSLDLLLDALTYHADGRTSADPTIGTCWDADRLNLWRVSCRPRPDLLSTAAGREQRRIKAALGWLERCDSWADLFKLHGYNWR
jgi:uncharacterized protein